MAHSLTAEDTTFYRLAILDVGIDFLFYGMQIAIFLAVIAASIRGGTRPRCVIILTTSVFLSSTLEVVLGFMFIFAQIPRSDGADATLRLLGLNVPAQLFIIFNFLASDAVVVWRAWILWPQSRVAKGILVSVVFNFVWQTVHWKEEQTPAFTLTIWLPLLVTNIVATGLVALQVWYYRRDIQRALGQWRKTTRVEKVLILLLDSGLVYCLILGTSLAVTFKVVKYGDPAYHITLNIATSAYHSIAVWHLPDLYCCRGFCAAFDGVFPSAQHAGISAHAVCRSSARR
ncbi:hypothetical protein EV122DRAFT_294885 [Schizophyllum commune]